ncbi:MAG: L-seryl-tRNA(Sec) selenium transferase, partial [Pseudomonadales bacterium]|nr:L-seryl-tRNA(Sec) selenium transferase [Pseudomonadales bacterium]
GTVIHTNLGRALLPDRVTDKLQRILTQPSTLEFDLTTGRRGERDSIVEQQICELTGAEAATVVNNNAAAVMLVLNSLAAGKEVPISRGELVEIGGSFRIPEVMASSGCKLVEVGATNRTHLKDYQQALSPATGCLMKVHTSNYEIRGFTAEVPQAELATLAHNNDLPMVVDLGSGTVVNLEQWQLPHEPTVQEAIADGADLITFSGDKLLGGPQAGLIAGKKVLIDQLRKNPLKRALRVDKITLALLHEVLQIYLTSDDLPADLPSLGILTRSADAMEAQARRLQPAISKRLGDDWGCTVVPCQGQIGSGALPLESLPGWGIAVKSLPSSGQGKRLNQLAGLLRALPVPVIGRISDGALILDVRCLTDEAGFLHQLDQLAL